MKVLLFGGSGYVGQGVLRECLQDPRVETVVSVGRRTTGWTAPKLEEVTRPDLFDLAGIEDRLAGFDACFFPLGVSSVRRTEADYRHVTFDLTLSVARTLVRLNPSMTFVYVSGQGTDRTEQGNTMWARVKGATENALLQLPFKGAFMFRPGIIQPRHRVRSGNLSVRLGYVVMFPFVLLLRAVAPGSVTTTENMGKAMIHVALRGWPDPILGNREINAAARSA